MKKAKISPYRFALGLVILLLVAATSLAFASRVAAATPIFVDPAGDDTLCDGTEADTNTADGHCAVASIKQAMLLVDAGGTINVAAGTYILSTSADRVTVNVANVTINGAGAGNTIIQVSQPVGYVFVFTADGATLQNMTLEKTDKAGQNLIQVNADNATVSGCTLFGQYVFGDADTSRAFEVAYGSANLTISNNTIHSLRQPGYLNGSAASPTNGDITNNLVYNTRGWVMAGANMTFTGNSWVNGSSGNIFDVAIINVADNAGIYPLAGLPAISDANNDAVIEDQRVSPAVLSVAHVNLAAAAGGNGGFVQPYQTIAEGITRVMAGGKVKVAAGEYLVDSVTLNKAGIRLIGEDPTTTIIKGNNTSGGANTLIFATSNALVDGFTITRNGNNPAEWNANVKSQGVIFNQGAGVTGNTLQNCIVTGNRNAIYLNNTQGNIIRNNEVDFNRTGIQFANNVSGTLVEGNNITNNWTMGILFNFDTGSQTTGVTITNNNISGNWYSQVESRYTIGTSALNLSGNWFGSNVITTTTEASGEPGYADQIPVAYGGSAESPATPKMLAGLSVHLIDYNAWLNSGTDLNTGVGFEGDFSTLWVDILSPQAGTDSHIKEGFDLVDAGGSVLINPGTYPTEALTIDKSVTFEGVEAKTNTIIVPAASYTNWISATNSAEMNLIDLTFDGTGKSIDKAILYGNVYYNAGVTAVDHFDYASGSVDQVDIKNIYRAKYYGRGIAAYTGPVSITNTTFTNIERIGAFFFSPNTAGSIFANNVYTGKGVGDWLDYGVEISGGGMVTIENNVITDCLGVASSDGSGSAAIYSSTFWSNLFPTPPDSTATITGNSLRNNGTAIMVGYDATDHSVISGSFNAIVDNGYGAYTTGPALNLENNWWGCNEGPNDSAGDCDTYSGTVDADPWLVLSVNADPQIIDTSGTPSTITADLLLNSDNEDTSLLGYIMDGIEALFSSLTGIFTPDTVALVDGEAESLYTSDAMGAVDACVTIDHETVCTPLEVYQLIYLPIIFR